MSMFQIARFCRSTPTPLSSVQVSERFVERRTDLQHGRHRSEAIVRSPPGEVRRRVPDSQVVSRESGAG